ncbi:hypothetical protein C7N43_25080 [Sphingobacteriales bacterium UPWRP_1]|nr:hypothetical protein BVG80_17195 [Sphingobacteriales bacterium TSM_CSM]PSJ74234.1 hypothetical protein C7N43_25080 [Sphingobacteriales bacterium UPWRP_1]
MPTANDFFTREQQTDIVCAIRDAESKTSGEIRVHIEDLCPDDVLNRAAAVFAMLELHKTAQRNGVLFYLALTDRKFAILGDAGIHQQVPPHFWDEVKSAILQQFTLHNFAQGLINGINLAGEKLAELFPYESGDKNELPDEISFGTN